jgi:hypothetical protein
MSRITGNDARGLMEAYAAVYSPPQEITEEQVWEEVEVWVNALLEEGYDLSDYTWEEMYEEFILEISADDIPPNSPASGGGMSAAEIDARTDLSPAEKATLKARRIRVPGAKKPGSPFIRSAKPSLPSRAIVKRASSELVKTGKTSSALVKAGKDVTKAAVGGAATGAFSGAAKGVKIPGLKGGGVLSAALGTADEKMKGSGWLRSLAKGAVTGTGAVLGGITGGIAGTAVAPGAGTAIGSYGGQAVGAELASKAFNVAAGANAKERKAMAVANRQRQSGGGLVGTGGKTTFDTKKNTITSGGKTAQLGKTSVVTGPDGKQGVGYLAYKGGKAVYKKPDTKSLAKTSSNPFERIGRSLFAGAYKANDAKLAAAKLKTAATSDATRNKQLGVKLKPGG